MKDKSKIGKLNRINGQKFENIVRKDLESKGWVVCRWSNNINKDGVLTQAKHVFNPYKKIMTLGTGFPDFIAYKPYSQINEIIGVEVKINGYLDPEEREKCHYYLNNKIFSKIYIAKKGKEGEVIYEAIYF